MSAIPVNSSVDLPSSSSTATPVPHVASANVDIRQLEIRLGGVPIIAAMDLHVQAGEFLVLLGPSGCGKSTLLHSIAGLLDVHAGSIEIGGRDVTWADPKDRSIGMVFQSYALYPTMSVERNMSFGLRVNGTPKAEIEKRVARAAEILHLQELLKRKPSQLSGGQRQRVAIGRALVRDVGVFLFDEPLSNLDAKLRAELRRELKQLHKNIGTTMVYVTHDQVEAMTLASRIAVMNKGRIQQIGAPGEIYNRPANVFVAGFLGSPSMNFAEGTLQVAGGAVTFKRTGLSVDVTRYAFAQAPRDGQAVLLGIRPEDIALHLDGAAVGDGTGTVALVEPMGAQTIVWMDVQGQQVSAMLSGHAEPAVGAQAPFRIAAEKVSLFDPGSQERL
ncbi:ABC transporter ATP-binding protein [Rhizobacter sp. P5_C2]